MATSKLNLTRNELATFLKDQRQIRAFENLFGAVDEITLNSLDELRILIGYANNPVQENSFAADYLDFRRGAPHASRIGRLAWNDQDKTLDIGMDYDVVQQVGLEYYARVENTTGSTIPNGTAVGFVGVGANNQLSVAPYLADGSTPSLYILGIMTHDLPDSGEVGYCCTWGHVRDVDTSGFSVGDILYADPSTPGALTNVKPTAPNNVIPLAAVLSSDVNGELFVRPTIEQMQYYAVVEKTTNQSPASTNTEYLLTFDAVQIGNGITIGTPTSRIVVPESGLYQINANVQITSGSSNKKDVWVWLKQNGVAIPESARIVTSDVNNGYVLLSFTETVSLAANNYIEIAFAANDTDVTVENVAATGFAPAAPAVLLSITQVQQ